MYCVLLCVGYTPCKHIFDRNLEKFCEQNPEIETWIGGISKEKWSMAYDKDGRRFGHMTTNLSECINKVFRGCYNLPITALVKSSYSRCREYFVERGRRVQNAIREGHVYCTKIRQILQKNQEEACSHIVHVYDIQHTRFEVEETFNPLTQRGGKKWTVILNEKYCQCGNLQYSIILVHMSLLCVDLLVSTSTNLLIMCSKINIFCKHILGNGGL